MKTKDLSPPLKKPNSDISILQWILLAAVVLFLFIFPFQTALFNGFAFSFEGPLFEGLTYTFVILLILSVRFYNSWKPGDYRSLLAVGVFLLPVTYFISYLNAVSVHNAKLVLLVEFMAAAFFISGMYIAEKRFHNKIIELSLQISGYVIVLYGLMNLFGQATYPHALWLADNGYRLASVFQYSNSYAALLTALFLAGLYSASQSSKWYWRALHSFMLVPIWISLMLTYSRAALLFIPILVLIILPFLRIGKQLVYLIYMFLALIVSFALLNKISTIADKISSLLEPDSGQKKTLSFWNHLPFGAWCLLLTASILIAVLIAYGHPKLIKWLDSRTNKFAQTKWSFVAVPLSFIAIGLLAATVVLSSSHVRSLLPQNIADRLESINFQQHSVLERETFYRDALKLSADYPVFGAGGGAWAVLYEKYQHNPYSSNQAHSFFMQTLVESGWLGLIVLVGFLLTVYSLYIRTYIKYPEKRGSHFVFFILSLSILLHSTIDFDMSYGYLVVIVFLALGAMLSPIHDRLTLPSLEAFKNSQWRIVYPVSISLLAVILIGWVYREYEADLNYRQALQLVVEGRPLSEALPFIDKAIQTSPDQPDYTLSKMSWMQQAFDSTHDSKFRQEYNRLLNQLQPYEPFNRTLVLYEYHYYKDEGQYDKVLQKLNEAVNLFPWDMNFYETAMMEYYLAGQRELSSNAKQSTEDWNQSLALYNEVLRRMELLKSLPAGQMQGREFDVSQLMRQAIGQIYYYNKNYQEAIDLLKTDMDGDLKDPGIRVNIRYYLASLNSLGQHNEELYNKLIEVDPDEKIILANL